MIEHPCVPFLLSAGILAVVKKRSVAVFLLLLSPLFSLFLLSGLRGKYVAANLFGYEVIPLRTDPLSIFFCLAFIVCALIFNVFSLHGRDRWEHVASFTYVGTSIGLVLAGDLLTLLLFMEAMAVSSTFLVVFGTTDRALRAAVRYLLFHLCSGSLLFSYTLLRVRHHSSLVLSPVDEGDPWSYLLLASFLINAAAPPFHTWLKDAYPESSVTGSVYLSAFTTKGSVYLLLRCFPSFEFLVPLGVAMALFGVIYALMEDNIRRLLSYHIVSQVGYMMAGIGLGTDLSMDGACFHALNNMLYKGALFMVAGAVIMATGKHRISDLKGLPLWRNMPVSCLFFVFASLCISGLPFSNGFLSKEMILRGLNGRHYSYLFLHVASAGTFLSISLKLFEGIFLGGGRGIRKGEAPSNMLVAMGLCCALCLILGLNPQVLSSFLPFGTSFHPHGPAHSYAHLLFFLSALFTYAFFGRSISPRKGFSLDFDLLYVKAGVAILSLCDTLEMARNKVRRRLLSVCEHLLRLCEGVPKKRIETGFGIALFFLLLFLLGVFIFSVD